MKTLFLAQKDNLCSTFGRNCKLTRDLYNTPNIADAYQRLQIFNIPQGEEWRTSMIQELLNVRKGGEVHVSNFSVEEIEAIIGNLCVT